MAARKTYRVHAGAKAGRWKAGVPVRCATRGCRLRFCRFTARRPADPGQCPSCKKKRAVDWYRFSGAEDKANRCSCSGYPFNHRRGSLFCDHGRAAKAGFAYSDRNAQEFAEWREAGMPLDFLETRR